MGVEEPEPDERPAPAPVRPEYELLGMRNRIIVGVCFFAFYTFTFGTRGHGHLFPGLVGGVLGGAVVYLLLKETDERRKRRQRRSGGIQR
jgi:hypothetical protein